MTDKLPPNLLALFAPRPPLRYLPPPDHAPGSRITPKISGLAEYLPALDEYKKTDEYKPTESHQQRQDRIKLEKQKKADHLATEGVKEFNARDDPKVKGDALHTLFLARLSYDVTEKDLEQEFRQYGPIERIRIVKNEHAAKDASKKVKNRGYAFIVFERAKDMTQAYKQADGLRIKGRSVLVDVERGRTVANWRPRRLGGGLGGRHYTKAAAPRMNGASAGFNGPPSGPGGFRGGFQDRRGGFRGDFGGGRGGGGFRGGFRDGPRGGGGFGGRGGLGYQSNGFGAPDGAPMGPRGGGPPNGPGGGGGFGGGRQFSGGDRGGFGGSGGNREPLGPRQGGGGGYRDRDQDGGYNSRKRGFDGDGGGYDDRRNKPRY